MASTTHWGTHCKEFQSILDNRQVLRAFLLDPRVDLTSSDTARGVETTLRHPTFFSTLDELITMIDPIHKAQVEAEGDDAYIGLVRQRWHLINRHIEDC